MAGQVESEIKLRTPGPEAARAAVAGLGARRLRARHFEDNVLLDAATAALGYRREDYITDSYAALFVAAGGIGDMVF